jgi:hypothetical protein
MGSWNTHGMDKDPVTVFNAACDLGMFPDELMELADHADKEAWIWTEMAKHEKAQKKRKANLIAGMWRRRSRRWKELAAEMEQDVSEEMGEEVNFSGTAT